LNGLECSLFAVESAAFKMFEWLAKRLFFRLLLEFVEMEGREND
jgi:hypothetical protein